MAAPNLACAVTLTAYNVSDGSQKWRFYTVPNPEGEADGGGERRDFRQSRQQDLGVTENGKNPAAAERFGTASSMMKNSTSFISVLAMAIRGITGCVQAERAITCSCHPLLR